MRLLSLLCLLSSFSPAYGKDPASIGFAAEIGHRVNTSGETIARGLELAIAAINASSGDFPAMTGIAR